MLTVWLRCDRRSRPAGLLRDADIDVRTRTGERRHVLMGAEVVELRGEKHAITTFVDITARRAAEDALQRSEARYRALFEYAPDGILIADRNSYYLDANADHVPHARLHP